MIISMTNSTRAGRYTLTEALKKVQKLIADGKNVAISCADADNLHRIEYSS